MGIYNNLTTQSLMKLNNETGNCFIAVNEKDNQSDRCGFGGKRDEHSLIEIKHKREASFIMVDKRDYQSDVTGRFQHSLMKLNVNQRLSVVNQKDYQSGKQFDNSLSIPTARLKNRRRGEEAMKNSETPTRNQRKTTSQYIQELTGKCSNRDRGNAWIDYFHLQTVLQREVRDED